jgi:RimJ/RimL family protein N-acetyltransferase
MDVHVRPLNHDEGALLDAVFAELSPQSRYLRFHSPVRQLTAATRRALLDVDGRDHVAVVAISPQGDAIGIARIIRNASRSHDAEVAFEVVDAWQGRGVGRGLLTAIVGAAGRIGLSRVHARVLTENAAALALLRSVFPICLPRPDGEAIELVCLLPGASQWEITMDDVLADLAA